MMSLLHIKNLSTNYEGKPVLDNINFSLDSGEILCLLGPSGSGKTTLLRILAGLDPPDHGRITFGGQNMAGVLSHKRNFGMMFQEYALFPHLNVVDNIGFGMKMHKWGAKKQRQRIEEMLSLVGLTGYERRRIDALSGGERQRVALARSLAPQPQLLLLDEPLGSLDRILRDRLAAEIRSILKSQGVTAVFVTHDQAEAFAVADKIAILLQGRLEQFDSPETVYRTPASAEVARFLGFKNILDFSTAQLLEVDTVFTNLPEQFLQNRTEQLLIRPEAATLSGVVQGDNLLPQVSGQVVKRQFQGHSYQIMMQEEAKEIELSFDLPINPPPPEVGEKITLNLNPSAMVWL